MTYTYDYGILPITGYKLRQRVVDFALSYLGAKEGSERHKIILAIYNNHRPLPRGYTVRANDAWCATFTSAAAIATGNDDIIPIECSCLKLIELAKEAGCWVEADNYHPQFADLCLYDWDDNKVGDNTGAPDHVGVVTSIGKNGFVVTEGNYSDRVKNRPMEFNGGKIRGFIAPDYDGKAKRIMNELVVAGFWDVQRGAHYYEKALEWAKKKDVVFGVDENHFGPAMSCTRGQIITMIWRLAGKPVVKNAAPFVDITAGAFYADAVKWGWANGIVEGISETEFAPDAPCTRAQIVAILARLGKNYKKANTNCRFVDVDKGAYYYQPLLWAIEKGLIIGVDEKHFVPNAECKRCEVVEILYRWSKI